MKAIRRFSWVILPLWALAGCVEPPPVVGAPCPCGPGYVCEAGTCQALLVTDAGPGGQPACGDPGPSWDLPLAADEYRNTVRDLLGVTLLDTELPPELWNPTHPPPSDLLLAPVFQALAKEVAERAAPAHATLFPCPSAASGYDACLSAKMQAFGERAFRRPITAIENDRLIAAFENASDEGPAAGARAAIEAALAVPEFYRRRLVGRPFRDGAPTTALDPWEMASRLSYFLWRSMPDPALFDAAANGQLEAPADIAREAERLLADPRTLDMLTHFLRERLEVGVGDLDNFQLPDSMPPEVHLGTLRSLAATGEHHIWREDRPHADLMTLPQVFADASMSAFYGLEAPRGGALEAVVPQAGQIRRGLLTSPVWLSRFAHGEQSAPVLRGSLVSRRFLCALLPEPPPGVPQTRPNPTPGASTREQIEQHTENPACSVCHEQFDPIGFGLENYDGAGRWRTHEGNLQINSIGIVNDTPFRGPSELAQYLASHDDALDCVVLEWFRFAMGRPPEQPLDAFETCTLDWLDWLEKVFREGGQRTQALLLALPRTGAFRSLRTPHHPAQK